MATEEAPNFDDMEPVSVPSEFDDSDAEWLDLEPGQAVVGEIRNINWNAGEYDSGCIELARGLGDVVVMWMNDDIRKAIKGDDLREGDVIGLKKSEEPSGSFENENGDETEKYDFEVRRL